MVDAKKLITGFLILAAIGSSFSFIFSNFNPTSAISDSDANSLYGEPPPAPPTNAFAEKTPNATDELINTAVSADDLPDPSKFGPDLGPDNLTSDFVKTSVLEVMKKNPDGPADDGTGNPTIDLPDMNQTLDKYVNTSDVYKNVKLPNWEVEAESAAKSFSVNHGATPADEENYADSIRQILTKYLINTGVAKTLNTDSQQLPDIGTLQSTVDSVLAEIKKIGAVPEKYAALHKIALKLLYYQKNGIALATDPGDDPMKAILILQAEEKNYLAVVASFANEIDKSQILRSLSDAKPSALSRALAAAFGIQTAHAQYFTTDLTNDFTQIFDNIGSKIWDELKNALIQLLKNIVFNIMGKQVINWVANGGTPRFIQNWKGFLHDIYSLAASAALSVLAKNGLNLCSPFNSILNVAFKPPNGFSSKLPNFSCTLDKTIANFKGFYKNFKTGGWKAYMSINQGQNNFWIAAIDGRDYVKAKAAGTQAAKKNEGTASKGFLGAGVCPMGTQPSSQSNCNPPAGGCPDPDGVLPPSPAFCTAANNVCTGNGQTNGLCYDANGDVDVPMLKTPGDVVGNAVSQGLLGASPQNVANANSTAGLLAAFISGLFNALLSRGLNLIK